jgi:ribA/ribD-fused uncharacterized protein
MSMFDKYKLYMEHNDEKILGFFENYRFLSNFHKCDVYYEGHLYPSSEHAYQAAKYPLSKRTIFLDMDVSASVAKKFGADKNIPDFDIKEWDEKKYEIMCTIVFEKFYRNKDLRKGLLFTEDRYLEETNHWGDHYWGVCEGYGENNLGKILMKVRKFWIDPV